MGGTILLAHILGCRPRQVMFLKCRRCEGSGLSGWTRRVLQVVRDPEALSIKARRSVSPKHLVCLIAKGSNYSVNAGQVVHLHIRESVVTYRHWRCMLLAEAADCGVTSY